VNIANTIIDAVALGLLRRLKKLEASTQQEFDYIASAGGAQSIPINQAARGVFVFLNGVKQSASGFQVGVGFVNIPVEMDIVLGDVLTITYWI